MQLRNGSLVTIPPAQIRRMKSHFHSLPFGVDLILGMNGYIWVCKHVPQHPDQADSEAIYSNVNEVRHANRFCMPPRTHDCVTFYVQPITDELRFLIARVCRAISLLGRYHWHITETLVRSVLSDKSLLSLPDEEFLRAALAVTDT